MTLRGIIVHSIDDARTALRAAAELNRPVALVSGPGAGSYGGVAWFEQMIAAVLAEFPQASASAVLDCADAPGDVLAAMRWLKGPARAKLALYFSGDADTAARLSDMAAQVGLTLLLELPEALDLRGARDPLAASVAWLAGKVAPQRTGAV
jgi:hypothetical protein